MPLVWNSSERDLNEARFAKMRVPASHVTTAVAVVNRLSINKRRYAAVEQKTGVPWWFIAILHEREASASFSTYLGNGEPLSRVTRLVPAGRGPFNCWEDGAVDALSYEGFTKITDWSIPHALFLMEKYNGGGYAARYLPSPYVWSWSNQYEAGKFTSDGHFDSGAVDKQCGGAVLLKCFIAAGLVPELLHTSPVAYSQQESAANSVAFPQPVSTEAKPMTTNSPGFDFSPLIALIANVAPAIATALGGPLAGTAVTVLEQAFNLAHPADLSTLITAVSHPDAAPVLTAIDTAFKAPSPSVPQISATAVLQPASSNGVLVDTTASTIKTVVAGLLFVVASLFIKDAAAAHGIADMIAPIATSVALAAGGGALAWLQQRSISIANTNTVQALCATA